MSTCKNFDILSGCFVFTVSLWACLCDSSCVCFCLYVCVMFLWLHAIYWECISSQLPGGVSDMGNAVYRRWERWTPGTHTQLTGSMDTAPQLQICCRVSLKSLRRVSAALRWTRSSFWSWPPSDCERASPLWKKKQEASSVVNLTAMFPAYVSHHCRVVWEKFPWECSVFSLRTFTGPQKQSKLLC